MRIKKERTDMESEPIMNEGDLYVDLYLGQYIEEVAEDVLAMLCNMPPEDVEIVHVYSTPDDLDFSVGIVIHNADVLDRVTDKIATYDAIDKVISNGSTPTLGEEEVKNELYKMYKLGQLAEITDEFTE